MGVPLLSLPTAVVGAGHGGARGDVGCVVQEDGAWAEAATLGDG